jgi:ribosomal protein S18 acetylase RimI-like enzyme
VVEVRRASAADVEQVSATLGRAFAEDPVVRWLAAPGDERYARTGPNAFKAMLRVTYMPKAEVYTTADGNAAVVWVPPDRWKAPASHTLRLAPPYLRLSGARIGRLLKLVTAMEKRHAQAEEPHWYIPFIGTDPAHQSKGLGSALLAHVLARADEEGRPAYLEASSPRNKLLYHRHGFEELDDIRVGDSPPLTVMWRKPR